MFLSLRPPSSWQVNLNRLSNFHPSNCNNSSEVLQQSSIFNDVTWFWWLKRVTISAAIFLASKSDAQNNMRSGKVVPHYIPSETSVIVLILCSERFIQCVWSYNANQFCLVESTMHKFLWNIYRTKLKVLYNEHKRSNFANFNSLKLILKYFIRGVLIYYAGPLQELIFPQKFGQKAHAYCII